MKTIKLALVAIFSGVLTIGFSQSVKVTEGSLAPLKGSTSLNVEYDWSNFRVGKFEKETEYLDKKAAEFNQKEPGKGDTWKASWNADKEGRYQPKFEELFNKATVKLGLNLGNSTVSKYKAIVKTTFIEPGYNVFVSKAPASANMEITIVETDNPSKVVAKIVITGSLGRTYGYGDMDTGIRIQECYALAGKKLGALLSKQLK
ncbi:MAG: hypothetical protein M9916_12210 [Crocinitomicaceae bacterium]|nr:hypothetical protein [Crocinitomicaceae bacterium]